MSTYAIRLEYHESEKGQRRLDLLACASCPGTLKDAVFPEKKILLASLLPIGQATLPPEPVPVPQNPRLSRFALLRFDPGEAMVLECPLAFYRIALHVPALTAWVAALGHEPKPGLSCGAEHSSEQMDTAILAGPKDRLTLLDILGHGQSHDCECHPLDAEVRTILLQWLSVMQALVSGSKPEKENADLAHWELHDLYFHGQSRPGRRSGRVQPYRWRGVWEPLPLVKTAMGEYLALPPPVSLPASFGASVPAVDFWQVLAARRSHRAFTDRPVPLTLLSHFLQAACRIQQQRSDELGGISFRPSPSAGALHGLEVYILAERCQGLKRGLYHYDALGHGLEAIPLPEEGAAGAAGMSGTAGMDTLINQACRMAATRHSPALYMVITARFRRYQWKYAQLAYSVMLKDLGCLHQTMSLCAEALELSSVILGDTPTEPFQSLAGLNWLQEGPVGSFSLGYSD